MDQRSIDLSAGTLRYRDVGRGEPLLFVHGFMVNGALWRKVVPELSPHFRCLVPDWPLGAHSVPMKATADLTQPALADLVAEFVRALGLESVTLVGNDMGGAICQQVVRRHPELVKRLVLTPCDAFENFPPPQFKYLVKLPKLPGVPFLLSQLMRLPVARRLPLTYGWLAKQRLEAATLEHYLRPLIEQPGVRRDAARVMTSVSPQHTLGVLPALKQFPRPVLLAWAREDRFFPFAHAEALAQVFPDARLEPIDDAYTLVAEDQPERLARSIAAFCAA